jgi:hypothetical protein
MRGTSRDRLPRISIYLLWPGRHQGRQIGLPWIIHTARPDQWCFAFPRDSDLKHFQAADRHRGKDHLNGNIWESHSHDCHRVEEQL